MTQDPFDPSRYGETLTDETLERYRKRSARKRQEFLRGPISWPWVLAAGRLPGQALFVGLFVWHWSAVQKTKNEIKARPSHLARAGISPRAGYRALDALEDAGLIKVARRRGRAPIITIISGAAE